MRGNTLTSKLIPHKIAKNNTHVSNSISHIFKCLLGVQIIDTYLKDIRETENHLEPDLKSLNLENFKLIKTAVESLITALDRQRQEGNCEFEASL